MSRPQQYGNTKGLCEWFSSLLEQSFASAKDETGIQSIVREFPEITPDTRAGLAHTRIVLRNEEV